MLWLQFTWILFFMEGFVSQYIKYLAEVQIESTVSLLFFGFLSVWWKLKQVIWFFWCHFIFINLPSLFFLVSSSSFFFILNFNFCNLNFILLLLDFFSPTLSFQKIVTKSSSRWFEGENVEILVGERVYFYYWLMKLCMLCNCLCSCAALNSGRGCLHSLYI